MSEASDRAGARLEEILEACAAERAPQAKVEREGDRTVVRIGSGPGGRREREEMACTSREGEGLIVYAWAVCEDRTAPRMEHGKVCRGWMRERSYRLPEGIREVGVTFVGEYEAIVLDVAY